MNISMRKKIIEVAIVGGGFSGAMVAYHLLRNQKVSFKINLIEPCGDLGKGVAYSTTQPEHLLNVPAGKMSALPDKPDHFLAWLHTRGLNVDPGQFVSRSLFGDYINSLLQVARASSLSSQFVHHRTKAVGAIPHGESLVIELKSGLQITSSKIVFALGNSPPQQLPFISDSLAKNRNYIANPWEPGVLKDISPDDEVLILGNGLTMIDTVLSLVKSGHRAKITSISRHGLTPTTHQPAHHLRDFDQIISPKGTIRETLEVARERYKESPQHWRTLIDSFRPLTQDFWLSLSQEEKARFLRHLHPYWETVRHRIAPEVAAQLLTMQEKGQLTIARGRIQESAILPSGKFKIQFTTPSSTDQTAMIEADTLINCTGPSQDIRKSMNPLIQSLLRGKLVSPGPLNIGVACEPVTGALKDHYGNYSPNLYAIGTLRKGEVWESTAVPELRGQACLLASHFVQSALRSQSQRPLVANLG